MSDTRPPIFNEIPMVHFAVVVEGDVAFTQKYPEQAENAIAALRSNPQIIEIPAEIQNSVNAGWTFDGTNFIPPVE